MDDLQKKTTRMTGSSKIQKYIFSDEIAAVYPPNLNSIRNAASEACEVTPMNNWKAKEIASNVTEEDFKKSRFDFYSDICLRGPAVCIKSILRKYGDQCKIKKIEDFGNGMAQAYVLFLSACVFEILRQNPSLRAACFAYVYGENSVVYSETGCPGFSHEKGIDYAKNEGDHWMLEADVLKDRNYAAFDSRSGVIDLGYYRFPYRGKWEEDQYVFEENGQCYLICPAGTDDAAIVQAQDSLYGGDYCSDLSVFSIQDSTLCKYKGSQYTKIAIPEGITRIGSHAFKKTENLTDIFLPDSVEEIGWEAFQNCRDLKTIVIPYSITKIDSGAFMNCKSLTSVTIPNGVTEIGSEVFKGCKSLTSITIPKSVTEIGMYAFQGCTSLTSVTIPNSVTEIEWYAFQGCTSLTSVIIPNSVKEIGENAFQGCTSLTSVTIPNSVTKIVEGTFENCTSLTNIAIPGSITEIGFSAFRRCKCLTSVTIPNSVTKIDSCAFDGCTSLTDFTIPDGVKRFNLGTFDDCRSLTRLTIPASVKYFARSPISNSPNVTIYAPAESYAIRYAKKYKIPFVAI